MIDNEIPNPGIRQLITDTTGLNYDSWLTMWTDYYQYERCTDLHEIEDFYFPTNDIHTGYIQTEELCKN